MRFITQQDRQPCRSGRCVTTRYPKLEQGYYSAARHRWYSRSSCPEVLPDARDRSQVHPGEFRITEKMSCRHILHVSFGNPRPDLPPRMQASISPFHISLSRLNGQLAAQESFGLAMTKLVSAADLRQQRSRCSYRKTTTSVSPSLGTYQVLIMSKSGFDQLRGP